ncbi:hypothetical protein QJQ45_029261 [Haematococcus lacustris]|nr:hypothetical protein QJQ45_029261 [Haematococcus lacustris]
MAGGDMTDGGYGLMCLQYLKALSAACVVALTLSYGTPIALSMWRGPEGYVHGPWHLGRWSRPLAAVSCTWILFISIVFCLPMAYPMTPGNANWAPLILSLLLAFALLLWWAPGFGGIHWFKGPVPNVSMPLPGSSQAALHPPTPQAAGAGPAPGTQAVTMPALPSTNSHPAGPGSGSVDSKLRKRNARCAERLLQTYSGFSPSSTAALRPSSQQSTEGRLSMGSQSRRASSQALGQLVPNTAHTACPAPSCTLPKELGRPLPSHTAVTASLAGHSHQEQPHAAPTHSVLLQQPDEALQCALLAQQDQPHAAELVGAGASPAPPPGASQGVPTEPLPMAQRSSASTRAHYSSRPSSSLATVQVRVRMSANALVADLYRDSGREGQAPALQPWVAVPALRLRHSQPARAPQSSCEAAAAAFVQPQPAPQRVESGAGMLEQLPHWAMGSSSGRPSSPMPQPPPSLHPPRRGVQASGTGNPAHPSSAPRCLTC